jgi:methionine sulfoxide reductase heme-binding subunit
MSAEWLVIRGSGVAAFALLTAACIWGLLVSSKLLGRLVKAKPLTWFHESLGVGALLATLVHIGVLSVHDFLDFTWVEILVPGVSDWRPVAITLGIAGFYGMVVVSTSFYFKHRIGHRRWRAIHFASFGVFVSSLLHGSWAGTDSSSPLMIGLYLGSAIAVFSLVALRMVGDTADEEPTEAETTPVSRLETAS